MSPVAPERKKRTVYARAALERMQLAHRLHEVLHLRQDEVLEVRRVSHERVGRSDAFHRGVEPGEAGVAATSERCTTAPYVTTVRSRPSRASLALPNGIMKLGPGFGALL